MKGVLLSVERPVVLTAEARASLEAARKRLKTSHDGVALPFSSSLKEHDATDRDEILERAYEDAASTLTAEETPLSLRLRKLWSERGDFSKYRPSASLKPEDDDDDSEKKIGEGAGDAWEGQVNLEGATGGKEDDDKATAIQKDDGGVDKLSTDAAKSDEVMSISEMLQLRTEMLGKLGMAQNALFFSHALVSLLINSTKSDTATHSTSGTARAGSPASASASVAGGLLTAKGDNVAGSTSAAQQRNANSVQNMGSSATLEAELGIEPHIFGASRLEVDRHEVQPSQVLDASEVLQAAGQAEHEEEEENLEQELAKLEVDDAKLSDVERKERAKNLAICLQSKREGVTSAVSILRQGAAALKGDEKRNERERQRWQALLQARRTGWGLTPDKPVRGMSTNKKELLDDGIRKRDEPSRDAFIGYAIPEARGTSRRKALAYFAHEASQAEPSSTALDTLALSSEANKTLRVRFVVGDQSYTSARGVRTDATQDNLESRLQAAQRALADAELFDAIAAECRAAKSVVKSSLLSQDHLSLQIGAATMHVELVSDEVESEKEQEPYAALAGAVLASLRLGLVRSYRQQVGISRRSETRKEVLLPMLLPVIGSIHYCSFLCRLQAILDRATSGDASKTYTLNGIEHIRDSRTWLASLLQDTESCIGQLGGTATISHGQVVVAILDISYPSSISLTLPRKQTCTGRRGVTLPHVELSSLPDILDSDLQ